MWRSVVMSVVAAGMWCVAGGWSLRRIGDPVVAAASAGVRLRTRIGARAEEAEALTAMGELLGSVYRGELVGRIGLGRWDRRTHARWRAGGKQAVTAVSSSRWAGVITRAVEDQYQLGMRGVAAHVAGLRVAVDVLARRCVLRLGQLAPVAGTETGGRSRRRRGGYRSAAERLAKTRRLAVLREPARHGRGCVDCWSRRRSGWAGNGCGATVTTSTPPTWTSSGGGTAGMARGCF